MHLTNNSSPTRCSVAPPLFKTSKKFVYRHYRVCSRRYLSFHPWTPNGYRPIITAQIASTSAIIDLPTSRGASLLAVSKGLPPPLLPSCDCDVGEEVVSLDVVEVFFEVVVVDVAVVTGIPPPRPPSPDCNCDVVEVEVVALALFVVVIAECA